MPSLPEAIRLARYVQIAINLLHGQPAETAVRQAGFRRSTARKKAYQIVRRPGVRDALIEINRELPTTPDMASINAATEAPDTNLTDVIALIYYRIRAAGRAKVARRPSSSHLSEADRIAIAKRVQELSDQRPTSNDSSQS